MKTQTINPIGLHFQNYFQHRNNSDSLNGSEKELKINTVVAEEQKKLEVLVVDDDRLYNSALVNYLKEHLGGKAIVKSFQTGEECLDVIDKKAQIVILDYFLNTRFYDAMNGISVLDSIKKKNPNVEVIMLSGQDKLEIAVGAMRHGAHNYIVKGKSAFPQIFNSVRNVVRNYSLTKEREQYRGIAIATLTGVALIVGITVALGIFAPQIFNF